MLAARLAITIPGILGSDWRTAGVKIGVFIPIYLSFHLVLEKKNIQLLSDIINKYLKSSFTIRDINNNP
jgi:hypothetical protein